MKVGTALQLFSVLTMVSLPALMDGVPENQMSAVIVTLVAVNLIGLIATEPVEQRRELVQRFA